MNKSENTEKVENQPENLRFSVIICAYNLETIVSTSIKSVLEQKYKNFELIVVDDCSKDNTLKVLREFEEKDSRVRVIANKENSGPSISRNIAVEQAKGEYIVYLDGDDTLYSKNTLKKIDEILGEDGADVTYFGVQYVGGSNKAYIPTAENSTREARIVCDMHFPVASKVWRREFLNKNNIKFIGGMYYEDMVYSIKAAILAEKLKYGAFPIYIYYRNREGSIMSTPNLKRCTDMYLVMYYLMELYEQTPERLQPYLMSFIKNETFSIPMRLDAVLKSMKDKTFSPVIPKRQYVYLGEEPTAVNGNEIPSDSPKVIPISTSANTENHRIPVKPIEEKMVADDISKKGGISILKFDDKN